jgi:DNA repair photolyase
MIRNPIYKPQGRAADYGELAVNIYTGCNHGCSYCYAPAVLRKDRKAFAEVEPRPGIIEALYKQLDANGNISEDIPFHGRTVHLCFTCDPYPADVDTSYTRDCIKLIKKFGGNHVQILTKAGNRARRDFDLLDGADWFGVSLTWADDREPKAESTDSRIEALRLAHEQGIRTWVSLEPVFDPASVYNAIRCYDFIDLFKIGKLNYSESPIDWREFGKTVEALCIKHERNYQIKTDLREEMDK